MSGKWCQHHLTLLKLLTGFLKCTLQLVKVLNEVLLLSFKSHFGREIHTTVVRANDGQMAEAASVYETHNERTLMKDPGFKEQHSLCTTTDRQVYCMI